MSSSVAQGATEMTVRTLGKVQNVEDFKQIPLVKRDDYSVLLSEIAEVKDSVKETRSLSLLNGVCGFPLSALTLFPKTTNRSFRFRLKPFRE